MEFGYNYNGYQMVEQQSLWKRPDTINMSSSVTTDHGSILIQEYDERFYANRIDTKSLI